MFSTFYTLAVLHVLFATHNPANGSKFPSSLPQCKFGDTECLPGVITRIIHENLLGNKELNLMPIDPLTLDKFSVVQKEDSPVNVNLHFRNITFTGIKDLVIHKVVGFERDPKKSKFEVLGRSKRFTISGKYTIDGKVLFLPIVGNGLANLTFENVNIHAKVIPKIETREGQEYVRIEKVKIKFVPTKFIPYFSNLFNDEALSKNMNEFLQQNSQDIFNEVKVSIQNAVAGIVKMVVSGPFDKFAYKDLFLADDSPAAST